MSETLRNMMASSDVTDDDAVAKNPRDGEARRVTDNRGVKLSKMLES